jgi:hypothetical protein
MTPFSVRLREQILASFPEWDAYARDERWQEGETYVVVIVPAPGAAAAALPLRISTYDDEITVDFDYYHSHFERWNAEPGDSRHQSALIYVRDLMAERVIVGSWWQGSHCKVCAQLVPGAALTPPMNVAYTHVRVRSWNGSHNVDSEA